MQACCSSAKLPVSIHALLVSLLVLLTCRRHPLLCGDRWQPFTAMCLHVHYYLVELILILCWKIGPYFPCIIGDTCIVHNKIIWVKVALSHYPQTSLVFLLLDTRTHFSRYLSHWDFISYLCVYIPMGLISVRLLLFAVYVCVLVCSIGS